MAVYINDLGEELEVTQGVGRAQLEALGWTLLRGDVPKDESEARPDVAGLIVVDHEAGRVLVDGTPFPYLIGADPIVSVGEDVQAVVVSLLADRVEQVGAPRNAGAVLDSAYTEPAADPTPAAEPVETAAAPWLGDLPGDAERAVAEAEKVDAAVEGAPAVPVSDTTPESEPDSTKSEEASTEPEPEPTPAKRPRSRRARSGT